MPRATRFSPEVRERAVRMVGEQAAAHPSQWAAIKSIRREDQAAIPKRCDRGCTGTNATRVSVPA